jgi:hypothetical protein
MPQLSGRVFLWVQGVDYRPISNNIFKYWMFVFFEFGFNGSTGLAVNLQGVLA